MKINSFIIGEEETTGGSQVEEVATSFCNKVAGILRTLVRPSPLGKLMVESTAKAPQINQNYVNMVHNSSTGSYDHMAAIKFEELGQSEFIYQEMVVIKEFQMETQNSEMPLLTSNCSAVRSSTLKSDTNRSKTKAHSKGNPRRRSPREGICELMDHTVYMSSLPLNACQIHGSEDNLEVKDMDVLLIDVLKHQIGGLDIVLSADLLFSCRLLLQGLVETARALMSIHKIITIDEEGSATLSQKQSFCDKLPPAPITDEISCLNKQIVKEPNNLKYQFIKLQLETLLVTICTSSTFTLYSALSNIVSTCEEILADLVEVEYLSIGWEDDEDPFRKSYWDLMETFYFPNVSFRNSENGCDMSFRKGKNYNTQPHRESSKDYTKQFFTHYRGPTLHTSNTKVNNAYTSNKYASISRNSRSPINLIVDLTNHVLSINNAKIINMQQRRNPYSDISTEDKETSEHELLLLQQVLKHQIAGLDISLSAELFDTAKLFLLGLFDTACSIVRLFAHQYYDKDGNNLPLRKKKGELITCELCNTSKHNQDDSEQIENTLKLCDEFLEKNTDNWKQFLIKLQLEALILTESNALTEEFRQHLEIMAGSAIKAFHQLDKQWWVSYFPLFWDYTLNKDEEAICTAYWTLMEAYFHSTQHPA